jgi:hypothetical protein
VILAFLAGVSVARATGAVDAATPPDDEDCAVATGGGEVTPPAAGSGLPSIEPETWQLLVEYSTNPLITR